MFRPKSSMDCIPKENKTKGGIPGPMNVQRIFQCPSRVIKGDCWGIFVFREYYVTFDALPGSLKGYELCKLSVPFRGIEWHCTLRLQRQFEVRWVNVF